MPIVTSSIALSPATALVTGLFAAAIPSIAIWLTDSMSRDGILITAGVPLGSPGTTDMIRIAYVDESGAPIASEV